MLIVTLVQIMGSQDKFMYNRIQQVVQDEAKYLMTIAVLTYTNTRVSSMNEVRARRADMLCAKATGVTLLSSCWACRTETCSVLLKMLGLSSSPTIE